MKKRNMFLGLMIMLLFLSCNQEENKGSENSGEAIRIETQIVTQTEPDETLNYTGAIMPIVSIPLSFKSAGTILTINVDEGDAVKECQLLASIDKIFYENSYKAALAAQQQAQDVYSRLEKVHDKGSLPEIQWEEVKAKLEEANSAGQIAKRNVENCELRAPSSGVIGQRNIEVGENTAPGRPVFDLIEIHDVYVKIAVPENEIGKIKKGQTAQVVIKATGNKKHEAIVEKIGVVANLVAKTYEVKMRMKNPNLFIKPGMVCDVDLNIEGRTKVIVVPYQSVIEEEGKCVVYVLDSQRKVAERREVCTGSFVNNNIEIISGLSVGDEVVVRGQQKLKYNNVQVEI